MSQIKKIKCLRIGDAVNLRNFSFAKNLVSYSNYYSSILYVLQKFVSSYQSDS